MKHLPKDLVILWTGRFNGEDHKVPETDTDKSLAVLIPRSEVATLEVSMCHVHVFGGLLIVSRKR